MDPQEQYDILRQEYEDYLDAIKDKHEILALSFEGWLVRQVWIEREQ